MFINNNDSTDIENGKLIKKSKLNDKNKQKKNDNSIKDNKILSNLLKPFAKDDKDDDITYYNDYEDETKQDEVIDYKIESKTFTKGIILFLSLLLLIPFILFGLNYIKKNVITNNEFKTSLKNFGILEKAKYQINYFVSNKTYKINFKNDNNKIIDLNNTTGYIEGLKEGNCTISVFDEKNNEIDKINVTVSKNIIPLLNFTVKDINIKKGDSTLLTIETTPNNTTDLIFDYQSVDNKIAVISNNGIIKGVNEGTTYIKVLNNGIIKQIKVIVK